MVSKFDHDWRSHLPELRDLLEAAVSGHPGLLDVGDIHALGERASWYGRAMLRGEQVVSTSMAHPAASLAAVVSFLSQPLGGDPPFSAVECGVVRGVRVPARPHHADPNAHEDPDGVGVSLPS